MYIMRIPIWKTLVDAADQSDSALFIKPTTGVLGFPDIGSDFGQCS